MNNKIILFLFAPLVLSNFYLYDVVSGIQGQALLDNGGETVTVHAVVANDANDATIAPNEDDDYSSLSRELHELKLDVAAYRSNASSAGVSIGSPNGDGLPKIAVLEKKVAELQDALESMLNEK